MSTGIQKKMEKFKPLFEKIASNQYIAAIRDGFIAAMPIILFSSIFLMIAYVPNAWGFYWSDKVTNSLLVAYNYWNNCQKSDRFKKFEFADN